MALPNSVFGLGSDCVAVGYQMPDASGNIGAIVDTTDLSVTPISPGSSGLGAIQKMTTGRVGSGPALFVLDIPRAFTVNTGTGVVDDTPLFDVMGFSYGTDSLDGIAGMSALDDSRKVIWVWGSLNGTTDSFIAAVDTDSPSDWVAGSYKKFSGVTDEMKCVALPSVASKAIIAVAKNDGGNGITVYDETGATIATQAIINMPVANPEWNGTNLFFVYSGGIGITDATLSSISYRNFPITGSLFDAQMYGTKVFFSGMAPAGSVIFYEASVAGQLKLIPTAGMAAGRVIGNLYMAVDYSAARYLLKLDLTTLP
jgi:hypothetical protein